MSKKEYASVGYVSQKLRESIQNHLEKKVNGEFPVHLHYANNVGTIEYAVSGFNVTLTISKEKSDQSNKYKMTEEITGQGVVKTFGFKLKPKRSKQYRISDDFLDWFAQDRMDNLRNLMN